MATGLQAIINAANSIEIDRRKVVGIQYTRNEIPRTSLTPTRNPWRINVTLPNSFRYSEARAIIEQIDTLDRYQPQVITFSDNPKLSWIFKYQGVMTNFQISTVSVNSFIGNQLVLQNLPGIAANKVLFEPNDIIQIGPYAYPFTSTTQVLRGSGPTVTVTTNRPNILSNIQLLGLPITVGNNVQWNVFCPNMPTYKLVVGGYQKVNGVTVNNALIEWSDTFNLYEYVGAA